MIDELFRQIDKGREGRNWGLSMGLPKLEQYVDGVSQGTYTVLFSGSGTGKTSLALYAYIYCPIMENLDNLDKFEILFLSLEMKPEVLLAKLLSTYILETYNKEISYKEMLSKTKNKILSDEDYELIKQSRPWLEKVKKVLHVYDKSLNAPTFFAKCKELADKNGYFEETENRKIYHANDPDKVILVITDHLAFNFKVGAHNRNIM